MSTCAPPPGFYDCRARAWSVKIRRIWRAHTAKKWARFCQSIPQAPILNPVAVWVVIGTVTLVGLMAAQPAFAEEEHAPSCALATLSGLYIFDARGHIISTAGAAPKAVVEFLNMNGDGTLTSVATANVNGTVIAHNFHGTGGLHCQRRLYGHAHLQSARTSL